MSATPVVDAHQHVGDLAHSLSFDGHALPPEATVESDASARVAFMNAVGIDWAVLQPSHGYLRADGIEATRRLNDRMASFADVAPGRFRILGTTEPLHGEASVAEVDRGSELGLQGFAWHHRFQGCYIDSRWMWPMLERMSTLGLVALVHVNAESSLEAHWRLQRLALDFPQVGFLAMDGLWTYERARHILMTAALTPNVIWDLGGPVSYVSVTEWVERNGSENACFSVGFYTGSNPVMPPLYAQIQAAPISDEDKANILGANVARLFGPTRS